MTLTRREFAITVFLTAGAGAASLWPQHPSAAKTMVEIHGAIERVRVQPGHGMPSLDVRSGNETWRVVLGSMRYLMEENFRPKAGDPVEVSGFRTNGVVLATVVRLPAAKTSLRLRDDNGVPVWRGGRRGKGHR